VGQGKPKLKDLILEIYERQAKSMGSAKDFQQAKKGLAKDFGSWRSVVEDNIADRAKWSRRAYGLVCAAMVWIGFFAVFGKAEARWGELSLSWDVAENVRIAMLGGFFLAVSALFMPVMKYLFPADGTKVNLDHHLEKERELGSDPSSR